MCCRKSLAARCLAVSLVALATIAISAAQSPLAAQEAESPLAAEEKGWPWPRLVYIACDGTFHLVGKMGTALVELGGHQWLVPLVKDKQGDGPLYWIYRQDRNGPCYVWAFARHRTPCYGYAIWLGYKTSPEGERHWLDYRWACQVVPMHVPPVPPVPPMPPQ